MEFHRSLRGHCKQALLIGSACSYFIIGAVPGAFAQTVPEDGASKSERSDQLPSASEPSPASDEGQGVDFR